MARELAWVFPLIGMCSKLKDSNPDCKCLTWFKYSCILTSLTSNSPFTWPTTNLEFENIFTVFPPIFWTIIIPTNRASYSSSLFMVEKPNLKDFSIMILSGEITTYSTLDPLWFATPSMYTLQDKGSYKEIMQTDFPSMSYFSTLSSKRDSTNLATKSMRT